MRQWVLASRPDGVAAPDNFELQTVPLPEIQDGQALVKVLYLGVGPVMLRYMNSQAAFERPMAIGDVMIGRGVGRVVASRNPAYSVGDVLQAKLGWREYALISDDPWYRVHRMRHTDLPLSYGIGSLGLSGFSALIGIREVCQTGFGDRVLVSAAAGGVGSQVAFMARALGAEHVVGIAGGAAKCRLVVDRLGYDAAIDYKSEDVPARIDTLLPDGVDVFFDNVGGELLDHVMARMRRRARIAICGRISEFLKPVEAYHRYLNVYRIGLQDAKLESFFVYDYDDRFDEFEDHVAQWIRSGQLLPLEDILDGLESMPSALIGLFEGTNSGIRMVRVHPDAGAGRSALS